jgi:hypothetical protein
MAPLIYLSCGSLPSKASMAIEPHWPSNQDNSRKIMLPGAVETLLQAAVEDLRAWYTSQGLKGFDGRVDQAIESHLQAVKGQQHNQGFDGLVWLKGVYRRLGVL